MRLALASAGIVAMLATSGCSGSNPEVPVSPTALPTASISPSVSSSPSPSPTAEPSDQPTPTPATSPPRPNPKPTPTTPQLDATATVSIATVDHSSGNLVVGGYVTGLFEDGGTCIFTVVPASGAIPLVATTTGLANVDSTSCGSTSFTPDRFGPGTYSVVLGYQNSKGSTASAPVSMDVAS